MFYVERGYPNELYHFGIKGMKWGVRRYQNKDGSLTTAGARRYNDAKGAYKNAKSEYRQARRAYTKSYDKAYGYSARHPVSQFIGKSRKAKSTALWETARDDASRANSAQASYRKAKSEYKNAKKAYKEERKPKLTKEQKRKRAIKVGAAVAGTALAAYGTYKLAKYLQTERSVRAVAKAQDYVQNHMLYKNGEVGEKSYYSTLSGNFKARIPKGKTGAVDTFNSNILKKGDKIYRDATNTRFDKGLSKIVDTGDAVGNATRKAASAVGRAGKKVGNRILDEVDPIYAVNQTTHRRRKIRRG